MLNWHEDIIDKPHLERFKEEVASLAANFAAMTHHPDGMFKPGLHHNRAAPRHIQAD